MSTTQDLIARLEALGDKWLEDVRVVRPSDVPRQVYHYTDAAGLHGMLSSNQIWLTHFQFLNDKTEFTHTRRLLDRMLRVAEQKKDPRSIEFIRQIRVFRDIDDTHDPFVFSLSSHQDDLSQWRGYAREGQGFTLGFDAMTLYERSCPDDCEYSFSRVDYDEERQLRGLTSAFDEFVRMLDGLSDDELDDDIYRNAGRVFDWLAWTRGALNKHPSFRSEAEWRVFSYLEKDSADVKVRVSGNRLVPYITTRLAGEDQPLPLLSIGVGPGFPDPEIGDAVRALARQSGYKVDVYFADTPYRRM